MQSGVATPESHGGEAERLRLAGPRFSGRRGQKKMAGEERKNSEEFSLSSIPSPYLLKSGHDGRSCLMRTFGSTALTWSPLQKELDDATRADGRPSLYLEQL